MQGIAAAWLYPLMVVAGALQAWGPPMNDAFRNALANPWLASLVSFLPLVAILVCVFLCLLGPLPTAEGKHAVAGALGGLVGALAGLIFVNQVGAGAFASLKIAANVLMSLMIDKHGRFGRAVHPLSVGRMAGAALMVGGIALISRF